MKTVPNFAINYTAVVFISPDEIVEQVLFRPQTVKVLTKNGLQIQKNVKGLTIETWQALIAMFVQDHKFDFQKEEVFLIMDNLKIHHNKESLKFLEASGFKVRFVPSYSSKTTSPCDNHHFGTVKESYRKLLADNEIAVPKKSKEDLIRQSFALHNNPKELHGHFKACGYDMELINGPGDLTVPQIEYKLSGVKDSNENLLFEQVSLPEKKPFTENDVDAILSEGDELEEEEDSDDDIHDLADSEPLITEECDGSVRIVDIDDEEDENPIGKEIYNVLRPRNDLTPLPLQQYNNNPLLLQISM